MIGVRERIAYLRGIAEGTELEHTGRQGQLLIGILDALQELAQFADETHEDLKSLELYVEEVDEALWNLEEQQDGDILLVEEEPDPEMVEWEMTCPSCGERVYYLEEDDDDIVEILCPVCGDVLWDVDNGFVAENEPDTDRSVPSRND